MANPAVPLLGRWMVRAVGLVAAGTITAACVGGAQSTEQAERIASIYSTLIEHVVDELDGIGEEDDKLSVFVDALHRDGIDLEVQVAVVEQLSDRFQIRFIDDPFEAIDPDDPEGGLRSPGVLIALGPPIGDEQVTVDAEWYQSREDHRADRYQLTADTDRWDVVGTPESIETMLLVEDR